MGYGQHCLGYFVQRKSSLCNTQYIVEYVYFVGIEYSKQCAAYMVPQKASNAETFPFLDVVVVSFISSRIQQWYRNKDINGNQY